MEFEFCLGAPFISLVDASLKVIMCLLAAEAILLGMNLYLCHWARAHFKFRVIKRFQDVDFSKDFFFSPKIFLKDAFTGKSSEMFFPQMVLPTEGVCLLFYLSGITQPSPRRSVFSVRKTAGGPPPFPRPGQLRALHLCLKTLAVLSLKAWTRL